MLQSVVKSLGIRSIPSSSWTGGINDLIPKFLIGYHPKRVQEVQNSPPTLDLRSDQMWKAVKAGHWLLNEECFFLNLIIYKALNFRWQHHHLTPNIPSLKNENIRYSNISNHKAAHHNKKDSILFKQSEIVTKLLLNTPVQQSYFYFQMLSLVFLQKWTVTSHCAVKISCTQTCVG